MTAAAWRPVARLGVAARGFALLTLAAPLLWARATPALPFVTALALVWAAGVWAQGMRRWSSSLDLIEAALVGIVCGLAIDHSIALLPALALPPFLSGLRHGTRGAAEALAAELVAVVGITTLLSNGMNAAQGSGVFTWTVMGLGLGLVAGFVHSSRRTEPDPLAPYRDARQLILELLDLSGGLSSGLDPVSLGGSILTSVLDGVPAATLAVHVARDDTLTPLTRKVMDSGVDASSADALAAQVIFDGLPRIAGQTFAFPLTAEAGPMAVVSGVLASSVNPDQIGLQTKIEQYSRDLAPTAVRLDTALLFSAFRNAATADERRRLAREMHDGVAQDIASMGYLVDALAANPASPQQAEQLGLLRDSITSIVGEVRRSVLTLRSSVAGSESLGSAISSLARHLSAVSGVPIKVTVDEQTTRLRPEVEAELLRITQEALNNSVRHAEASLIDVQCRVYPPGAMIVVSDNGRGLQSKRIDSHGLEIMQERARLIDARLEIGDRAEGGARVSVEISGESDSPAARLPRDKERVA